MVPEPRELTPQLILDYIQAHFTEPITPRDVAAAMNYSLCHLTHLARKTLGGSIGDLILERRIDAARRLLEETGLSVSAVARRVGFRDMAYFSRRFSRATGTSPSHWRKQHHPLRAPSHCHLCGTVLPLVAFTQDDAAQVRSAAS